MAKEMWRHVGLLRSADSLRSAQDKLEIWSRQLPATREWIGVARVDDELFAGHATRNALLLARLITAAALTRSDSVGSHSRLDRPDRAGVVYNTHVRYEGGDVTVAVVPRISAPEESINVGPGSV